MSITANGSATNVYMTDTVGIRELRQNLSAVLKRVKDGETLVVTERNRPVAQLAPLRRRARARLIAEGRLIPAEGPLVLNPTPLKSSVSSEEALDYVRGDR